MTKDLQDLAWTCLPKEFKEEVKKMYSSYTNPMAVGFESHIITCEYIFGKHNLTSDAEGEEMLMVSRKKVQELYAKFQHSFDNVVSDNLIGHYTAKMGVLKTLFGSKCLPDEEPKPAEPKFKVGDVAVISSEFKHPLLEQGGAIVTILSYHPNGDFYSCAIAPNVGIDVDAKYLEPYADPKEDHIGENTEMVKDFDTILKDGFHEHNRLHIAAMIMAAMMQNAKWGDKYSHIATMSCAAADALIAESEKGDTK